MFKIRTLSAIGNVSVVMTDLSFEHFSRLARGLNFTDNPELQSSENAVWDPGTNQWTNTVPAESLSTAYQDFARDTFE